MGGETRAMLLGAGITLGALGAVYAVGTMAKAPDPPAIAEARKEERAVRRAVQGDMHEFMEHYRRANVDVARGAPKERVLAHLVIMQEFAEDLQQGRMGHEIPAEQLRALKQQIDNAYNAVDNAWPSAKQELAELKSSCVACHQSQGKGPTQEDLFPPALKP